MQLRKAMLAALGTMVLLSVPAMTFAQEGNNLTGHATNLTTTDTAVNFTNTGSSWNSSFPIPGGSVQSNGNICVNIYALNQGGGVDWCCQCILTPNSLSSFSAHDLNTLSTNPANLTIKMIATAQGVATSTSPTTGLQVIGTPPTCDASHVNAGLYTASVAGVTTSVNALVPGLIAWGRSQNNAANAPGTESLFATSQLSTAEAATLNAQCLSNKNAAAGGANGYCSAAGGTGPFAGAGGSSFVCRSGGL